MNTLRKIEILKQALVVLPETEFMCNAIEFALWPKGIMRNSVEGKVLIEQFTILRDEIWEDRIKESLWENIGDTRPSGSWYPSFNPDHIETRIANIQRTIKRLEESLEVRN